MGVLISYSIISSVWFYLDKFDLRLSFGYVGVREIAVFPKLVN